MTPEQKRKLAQALELQQKAGDAAMNGGVPPPSTGAPAAPDMTGLTPAQQAKLNQALQLQGEVNKPAEASPYDTWGGTLTQIGKVLGSGVEQAGTGILGIPAMIADTTNAGIEMLPEYMQKPASVAVNAFNPVVGLSRAARSAGAPSAPEMDQYLRDKGLQHTPINEYEDWAQYLTSVAASAAVPVGQGATLTNAGKSVLSSILPAAAGKAVADNTESPAAGLVATLLTALGQHGVVKAGQSLNTTNSVGKSLANDASVPDLEEYKRLGVPAMTMDVLDPNSSSSAALIAAVKKYPEKAKSLVSTLTNRNAGAGTRAQKYVEDAISPGVKPPTKAQLEERLFEARKAEADVQFPTVREGQLPVDIRGFGSKLRAATRTSDTNAMDEMQSLKLKYFNKLAKTEEIPAGPGGQTATTIQYTRDPSKIYAVTREMEADAKRNPHLADDIGALKRELDGTLEVTYPHYADIKENFRKASEEIEALNAGASAAQKGRSEDVVSSFNRLGERPHDPNYTIDPAHKAKLEAAFRTGYGDTSITKIQNTTPGMDPTRPVSSRGISSELPQILDPDTAAKLDFEATAKDSGTRYTPKPDNPKGLIQKIMHTPGYGFSALTSLGGLGALGGAALGSPLTTAAGVAAGGVGIANLIRNPRLAKAWIEAAGIDDPELLKKLIARGENAKYTLSGNVKAATKAGLINAITGYGR